MNNETNTSKLILVHGKDLKEIAHESKSAETALYAMALRERLRTFTDINRLRYDLIKKGHKIIEQDFLNVFKGLSDKGMGSIVYGKGDKPTRFEWNYSMKAIAEAALDGKDIRVEPIKKPLEEIKIPVIKIRKKRGPNKPKLIPVKHVLNSNENNIKHVFIPFRNELLEFKFPLNVTQSEIEQIVKAFKYVS